MAVEGQLSAVSAEQFHAAACFRIRRQLHDHRGGQIITAQSHAVQPRRESGVFRDPLGAYRVDGHGPGQLIGEPARGDLVDVDGHSG
jgi:hypothetical protein